MSIVVALFVGMVISASEIVKDRNILKREAFLNLSYVSYINSKVVYLFALSFIQVFTYVLVANYLLKIENLNLSYIIILWTVACYANLTGLLISTILKSVTAIYIVIPFILIPQILLAGVVVNFDKLHHIAASQKYVPFIADVITSRWAFEALAINQYKNNEYQRLFFETDIKISACNYNLNIVFPDLIGLLNQTKSTVNDTTNNALITHNLNIVKSTLLQNDLVANFKDNKLLNTLSASNLTSGTLNKLYALIDSRKQQITKLKNSNTELKDSLIFNIVNVKGENFFTELKQTRFNQKLSDMVLNNNETTKSLIIKNQIIRKYQPIYQLPEHRFGRSHFYAPYKKLGEKYIPTEVFNTFLIWIFNFLLYITIASGILQKVQKK